MKALRALVDWLGVSPRPQGTLVVAIHELPNPRGWGTLSLSLNGRTLLCKDCDLYHTDKAETAQWVRYNGGVLRSSGFTRVAYENVASELQRHLHPLLIELQTSETAVEVCV